MSKSIQFILTKVPRTLQAMSFRNFGHKKAFNDKWYSLVYSCAKDIIPEKPLSKCHIEIMRVCNRFISDYDNLVYSFKPVVDGIVRAGIIIDDSYKMTGKWDVDQRKRLKGEVDHVQIRITEK